jgi:hypothetical protein
MSRKRHNPSKSNQTNKSAPPASSPSNGKPSSSGTWELANAVSRLHNEAIGVALKEDIEPKPVEIPQTMQHSNLESLYKEAQEAESIFKQARTKYETLVSEARQKRDEIADAERRWQEKHKSLDDRETNLNQRDAEITGREADATTNFLAQHESVLGEVKARIEALRKAYDRFGIAVSDGGAALIDEHRQTANAFVEAQRKTLTEMRNDYQNMLSELRNHWEQELQDLNQREQALVKREKDLRNDERKLRAEQEIQRENKEEREALMQEKLDLETRHLQERIDELTRIKETLRSHLDQRVEELRQWDDLVNHFNGAREPEAIEQLFLARVKAKEEEIQRKFNIQNSEKIEHQLSEEQENTRRLTDERDQLKQQIAALQRQNNDLQVNAWDLEDAQLAKKSLEKSRELLQARLEDLQAQIDKLTDEQARQARPFEQCSAMDSSTDLQKPITFESIGSLKSFARDVQKKMEQKGFYYDARDVRSFIGGLAMSRLMILQGISGTGKTSLPIQFAQAVGGACEVIEVQSSWRDREDLMGYYNSFERRFHERAMLTALYQAHCPHNRDRIFIILLDEMNLSYPEQYFADFLSVLERQETTDASLEIVSKHIDAKQLPKYLIRGYRGIQMSIPANVWFVGTANRDETTKDIADKTYDRAHIMELPDTHANANGTREDAQSEFIPTEGYESLLKLFEEVVGDNKHLKDVDNTLQFLNSLREGMANILPLTWGNRLEKQIRQYIPVILACGGDITEAIDHILVTRILRKLRDRYDVSAEGLQALQKHIDKDWRKFETAEVLKRSNQLLTREIAQKQRNS